MLPQRATAGDLEGFRQLARQVSAVVFEPDVAKQRDLPVQCLHEPVFQGDVRVQLSRHRARGAAADLDRHQLWRAVQRILDAEWIYKMTRPSFEDAKTGYAYPTWLNASSNIRSPGSSR
jgi:hypothetical protein